MNRDDIIRMAKEAGFNQILVTTTGTDVWIDDGFYLEELWHFADLVAAEKDKEIARLREENIYLKEVYEDLVEDRKELFDDLDKAVAAEREACAKVCFDMAQRHNDIRSAALETASEYILARGKA